jgi:phosphoribosylformimino-5-aminoimidazole carboxamide ribonucleotide (ProFAR) isomerase
VLLDDILTKFDSKILSNLIVCFNINNSGFNVFPSLEKVEMIVFKDTNYKKMGMSILSSGGVSDIQDSLLYIKSLPLDYVVYGSSNIKNIKSNFNFLRNV